MTQSQHQTFYGKADGRKKDGNNAVTLKGTTSENVLGHPLF